MQTETIIYSVLAFIFALVIALFQYRNKIKSMSISGMLFILLRFISVFSVLLLLVNPKIDKTIITEDKPNLIIAIDNSVSIKHLNKEAVARDVLTKLTENKDLKSKFNITSYSFGTSLKNRDSLSFSDKQTDIHDALVKLDQIYRYQVAPVILISDGNQTYGKDYQFATNSYSQPIYPVVIGDTTRYIDLKIEQLHVNRYAYLKNKFPVESILTYRGNERIRAHFTVTKNKAVVFSRPVSFSGDEKTKVLNFSLPANTLGLNKYKATLLPLNNEKNTSNNIKNFTIDVINKKIKIALVSEVAHPDLGALKKSIESNEQRTVIILDPHLFMSQNSDFDLVILYQPNQSFKGLLDALDLKNSNRLVVTGTNTDLIFFNSKNRNYQFEITNETEQYQAAMNRNYAPFSMKDLDFETLPPLSSNYGAITFSVPYQTLLYKTINGVSTKTPLLTTFEANDRREAVVFGENIWQWRAQSFLNSKSFNEFDDFMGAIIQYLTMDLLKSRLQVTYHSSYNASSRIVLKAACFDENFVFDKRKTLQITVTNNQTKNKHIRPLLIQNNHYQVDLSDLMPGNYHFKVQNLSDDNSQSGSFEVLEYDIEKQFLNPNVKKLRKLAKQTTGALFFTKNAQKIIPTLINDKRYVSVQKEHKKSIPLIDWKYLLIIIAFALGAEWFIRKFNGLI